MKTIKRIRIRVERDNDPDLSYLDSEQDKDRIEAYDNDEWHMIAIIAEVQVKCDQGHWHTRDDDSASSTGNIESDNDFEHFIQEANELANGCGEPGTLIFYDPTFEKLLQNTKRRV